MRIPLAIAATFLGFSATAAQAVELVANGGFETGNFSGWTLTEPGGFSVVGSNAAFAKSGNHYAALAPAIGAVGSLSQTLATTAGESYQFSFWLANNSNLPVNSFSASFGGTPVLTTASPPFSAAGNYVPFSFAVVATSASTVIEFRYRHDDDFWRLDDVSVQTVGSPAVPEPATWLMMIIGFGMAGMSMRVQVRGRCAAA